MSDIRGLLSRMDKAGDAERKRLSGQIRQQIQIVERGVGGVAKGKTVSFPLSDGRLVQKVTEVVAGSGAVVRAISFCSIGSTYLDEITRTCEWAAVPSSECALAHFSRSRAGEV